MKHEHATSSQSGLSTLEVLVAMAILAVAIIPILQFQSQLAASYRRYDELIARTELERNALTVLSAVNPMEQPEGALPLGLQQEVRWQTRAISEEKRNTAYPVGDGDFIVGLFRIDATAEDTRSKIATRLTIQRLGWRKSVSPSSHLPVAP